MTNSNIVTVVSTNDTVFPLGIFADQGQHSTGLTHYTSTALYFGTSSPSVEYFVKSITKVTTANQSTTGIHFLKFTYDDAN
jgi:hypothetical protein